MPGRTQRDVGAMGRSTIFQKRPEAPKIALRIVDLHIARGLPMLDDAGDRRTGTGVDRFDLQFEVERLATAVCSMPVRPSAPSRH